MSIKVKYADIAIGAKEAFDIEVGERLPASNVELLKADRANFKRYDTPFELNSMILDGGTEFLPEKGLADISFISEEMSDDEGNFQTPIVWEFLSSETFASIGLSFLFDELKNIYATHVNIKWYNGSALLEDADFYPTSARYFCNKTVRFFNRISVTFYSLNVSFNRLRVNAIDYGLDIDFEGNELKNAKIIQEIDPISTSVPINTFDFTLNSGRDIEFSFQAKQPLKVMFNDQTKATMFIKSAKRKSKSVWDIKSEDYIGLMDSIDFRGGIYNNYDALALIGEIFSAAKTPYSISSGFEDAKVTGHIPYTSCREALMQVLFAIGAVADTSNSDSVNIFSLSQSVSQNIPKRRLSQGQSFEEETRVTAVELISHSYNAISEVITAYDADKSGAGDNILVKFSEPLHDLSISGGTILESGVNYAIINATSSGCVLSGKKYEHTTVIHRKENPLVLSSDIENIVAIQNATLVSSNNVDYLLELCYNYIVNTNKTNMKIIEGDNNEATAVGDFISFETEYLGSKEGRIIKQSFALVGSMLVKDSVVR